MREITPEPKAMIPAVRSAAKVLLVSSEAAMARQFRADEPQIDRRRGRTAVADGITARRRAHPTRQSVPERCNRAVRAAPSSASSLRRFADDRQADGE